LLGSGGNERRCSLAVHIGNAIKTSHQFTVSLSRRITDFEGGLKTDLKDLKFDEHEYEEILRQL
jgi:hypothetical protein